MKGINSYQPWSMDGLSIIATAFFLKCCCCWLRHFCEFCLSLFTRQKWRKGDHNITFIYACQYAIVNYILHTWHINVRYKIISKTTFIEAFMAPATRSEESKAYEVLTQRPSPCYFCFYFYWNVNSTSVCHVAIS